MTDKQRCDWADAHPLEAHYHDTEWGVPVHDDRLLFEMLMLEAMQAGLSWLTVLQKREGYQSAFDGFNAKKITQYTDRKKAQLLVNPNIIRHKLKINAIIENAHRFLDIQKEYGSFDGYIWSFVGGKVITNQWPSRKHVPSTSVESDAMSKSLKKNGFKFVGSTTCYAYMQGVGMINDHVTSCFRYKPVLKLAN